MMRKIMTTKKLCAGVALLLLSLTYMPTATADFFEPSCGNAQRQNRPGHANQYRCVINRDAVCESNANSRTPLVRPGVDKCTVEGANQQAVKAPICNLRPGDKRSNWVLRSNSGQDRCYKRSNANKTREIKCKGRGFSIDQDGGNGNADRCVKGGNGKPRRVDVRCPNGTTLKVKPGRDKCQSQTQPRWQRVRTNN